MSVLTAHARLERRRGRSAAARLLRAAGVLGAALMLAAAPRAARAQASDRTVRLTIMEVGDSTFSFNAANLRWVKAGARGIAVDPQRRDALVARFDVLHVENGRATALITGATTVVTTDHVAVMEVPIRPWYHSTLFWAGAMAGTLVGAILGSF